MQQNTRTQVKHRSDSILATNAVIRNTYALLSMTLVFSAFTAFVGVKMEIGYLSPMLMLAGYFGLFFLVHALKNSALGILAVFALTQERVKDKDLSVFVNIPVASGAELPQLDPRQDENYE